MCVCVSACTASYGLNEDQWQAVVNTVTNTEVPYNACNFVLLGSRVSKFKMEVVCSSQTLIPTCQTV